MTDSRGMINRISLTNREVVVSEHDFIVSKTGPKGKIVYANRLVMRISGYRGKALLGRQHNLVRHPDMSRGLFHLLRQTVMRGRECFAYVKNLCQHGDPCRVLAGVTPDYGPGGEISGCFSARRKPNAEAVEYFSERYRDMPAAGTRAGPAGAVAASTQVLEKAIHDQGFEQYETFVFGH